MILQGIDMYLYIEDTAFASAMVRSFNKQHPVFADTETDGLGGAVRTIQLYQPKTVKDVIILDFMGVDANTIKPLLEESHLVWANASYDLGVLDLLPAEVDDVQLLVRTAYPYIKQYTLDNIVHYLLPVDLYKDLDKKAIQKEGFKFYDRYKQPVKLTEMQLKYAATDVIALHHLWQLEPVQAMREATFYKVDMLSLKYAVQFQRNGAIVDQVKLKEEIDKLPAKLEAEEAILQGVNSKSPKQVKEKFTELLGSEPAKTDKSFLIRVITEYTDTPAAEFAQAVFDNRRTRLRATNLENLNHPKVFTRFNPYGTVTGRFSSSGKGLPNGINFQNVTRDLQYLLAQDTEDTVVIHADYSTAELRAACSLMEEPQMREYLLNRVDLHKVSAQLADPSLSIEEVTKEDRQRGKAVSFGFIFGMGADRFKDYAYDNYNVAFTDVEAKEVRNNYYKMYPKIAQYHKFWWNNYKETPAESPLGRKALARAGTDAINFSTQSAIGETAKLSIHYMIKEEPKTLEYMYSQVHDAIYLRVPKAEAKKYTKLLVASMLRAWDEILKVPSFKYKDIPMGVEYEVGDKVAEVFNLEELERSLDV